MRLNAPECQPSEMGFYLGFYRSGCRDLNSGPSVPQIDAPQTADLRKHPETCSGLPIWFITGSR